MLNWSTPYSIIFKQELDYTTLKPFGCLVYAVNLGLNRSKFDSRNFKCVFLGYNSSHKGYLLYNLDSAKVITSRDVHFVPNVFPFKDNSSPAIPDFTLPIVNPNVPVDLPAREEVHTGERVLDGQIPHSTAESHSSVFNH